MNHPELSNSDLETQLRKSYVKPRIERVSLVPQETVLGGCKIATSSGSMGECHPIGGLPCDRAVDVS